MNLEQGYNSYERLFLEYNPSVVVLEKINVQGMKFGALNVIKLAQLQAMIRLLCDRHNIPVYEVNPTSMKKTITGYGKADKTQIADCISKYWNLKRDNICIPIHYKKKDGIKEYKADESDAIGLGTCYLITECNLEYKL